MSKSTLNKVYLATQAGSGDAVALRKETVHRSGMHSADGTGKDGKLEVFTPTWRDIYLDNIMRSVYMLNYKI